MATPIKETPSYSALVAARAAFKASQDSAGVQAPATLALGKTMKQLVLKCANEAGIELT